MTRHRVLQTLPLSHAEERAPQSAKHPETGWAKSADCTACVNLPWFPPLGVPQSSHSRMHGPSKDVTQVSWADFRCLLNYLSHLQPLWGRRQGKKTQPWVTHLVWNPVAFLQKEWLTCNHRRSFLDPSPLKIASCCGNLVHRGLSSTF